MTRTVYIVRDPDGVDTEFGGGKIPANRYALKVGGVLRKEVVRR